MRKTVKPPKSAKWIPWILAGVVFVSGYCSLAYQVVWLREFRLIFGGAAPAAAAVLAVFMGGLGFGGLWLGRRVERAARPGIFYAGVEGGITLLAAISPLLLMMIQWAYMKTGGVQTLGLGVATTLQVVMTAMVIGPSCFLMGGTLPAVLRVVQSDRDERRATTAVFYGLNVAGAVTGAFLTGFVILARVGNTATLLWACLANALIAGITLWLMRGERPREMEARQETVVAVTTGRAWPRWLIPGAALMSGFVFFLIELVWYRVSIPLFGGSVYNFGLILAVALAGIGSGSLVYSLALRRVEPTLGFYGLVSALLALCMILPFALGDHLAHAALLLNGFFMPRSFEGLVFGWTCVCVVLVFLPAFFSGIQFPLLISLAGEGGHGISSQVGRVYGWNTLGAVFGSLLGGFVLIPGLSITGSWRLAAVLAASVTFVAVILQGRRGHRSLGAAAVVMAVVTLMVTAMASGPSAYWLHHPIGYGRANPLYGASAERWEDYVRDVNRSLVASRDGLETSVAVTCLVDYAILSNGKSDSSAIGDSSTTVMSGLLGAMLHQGEAKAACVVGFGTGITAGWLAKVDSIKRVDIIELEPAVVELGRYFAKTNLEVMKSPKARLLAGDAREILITQPERYDLIVSEPSNLHRAGVANLYTVEFYESVAARLGKGGLFCQWVQTYETDLESVRIAIATLCSVFPKVEMWQAGSGDLLMVCGNDVGPWSLRAVQERLRQEPFATGVRNLWGTSTLEGFFSRAVGNAAFAKELGRRAEQLNTDDWNVLEFRAAQNLGVRREPVMARLMREAGEQDRQLPEVTADGVEFVMERWAVEFVWKSLFFDDDPVRPALRGDVAYLKPHVELVESLRSLTPREQLARWPADAVNDTAVLLRLSALAATVDERFSSEVEAIRDSWPAEYHVLWAEYLANQSKAMEALERYSRALELLQTRTIVRHGYQRVIWPGIERQVKTAVFTSAEQLQRLFALTEQGLSYGKMTDAQRRILMSLAMPLELPYQVRAARSWGEHPPWSRQVLEFRRDVFKQAGDPEFKQAERDLQRFLMSVPREALEPAEGGQ